MNFILCCFVLLYLEGYLAVQSSNTSDSLDVRFSAVRYLVTKNEEAVTRSYFDWGSTNVTIPFHKTSKFPVLKLSKKLKKPKKPKKNKKITRKTKIKKPKNKFLSHSKYQKDSSRKKYRQARKHNKKSHKVQKMANQLTIHGGSASNEEPDTVKILPEGKNLKSLAFQPKSNVKVSNLDVKMTEKLWKSNFYLRCGKRYCDHSCFDEETSKCGCYHGFTLAPNNITCLDINECRTNNGGCSDLCRNVPGSYKCQCPNGLRLSDNGRTCEDINECLLRNNHGPCEDICTNIFGGYKCKCSGGMVLAADNHSCNFINLSQCASSGCSHTCITTRGKTYCTCPDNFQLDSDWKTCKLQETTIL